MRGKVKQFFHSEGWKQMEISGSDSIGIRSVELTGIQNGIFRYCCYILGALHLASGQPTCKISNSRVSNTCDDAALHNDRCNGMLLHFLRYGMFKRVFLYDIHAISISLMQVQITGIPAFLFSFAQLIDYTGTFFNYFLKVGLALK